MKIYFFPGLGADSSLAPLHILPGHEVHWIDWPRSFGKSWDGFIQEILNENSIEPDAVYAGISFGGLVAQRMARRVKPRKIIFIGSLRSSKSISRLFRTLSPFIRFVPYSFFNMNIVPGWLIRYYFGIENDADLNLFYKMASKINGKKAKMLITLALSEKHVAVEGYSVQSIHGADDKIIPRKKQVLDTEIPNAGHLISMTNSKQVNEAILSRLS